MLSHRVLRWGVPLLLSGFLIALFSHHSPAGQVFGPYSSVFLVLIATTGCLTAACWWVALDASRYQCLIDRLPTLIGVAACLVGCVALLDLFVDATPAVAWLPLPCALLLFWLTRDETRATDTGRARLSEPVGVAVLLIGATVLSVIAAEIAFRTVLVDHYVPTDDPEFERMIAADWPRPIPRQRDPGTLRILHLGDSFGKAGGRKNFQYVLEALLRDSGIPAEVVDFSRPGYEPLEQLALLRRFGEVYQPDIVLHGFFVGNDFETPEEVLRIYEGLILRPASGLQALRPHNFLLRRWLLQYLAVIRNDWQKAAEGGDKKEVDPGQPVVANAGTRNPPDPTAGPATRAGAAPVHASRTAPPAPPVTDAREPAKKKGKERPSGGTMSQAEFLRVEKYRLGFYAPGPPPQSRWRETARLLAEIRSETERIGSDYMMVIHPDQLQVEPEVVDALVQHYELDLSGYDLQLPQRFLMALCAEHGFPCVNLLPEFQAAREPLYLLRDTHYNHRGNRLAAEAIHAKLGDIGAIDHTP